MEAPKSRVIPGPAPQRFGHHSSRSLPNHRQRPRSPCPRRRPVHLNRPWLTRRRPPSSSRPAFLTIGSKDPRGGKAACNGPTPRMTTTSCGRCPPIPIAPIHTSKFPISWTRMGPLWTSTDNRLAVLNGEELPEHIFRLLTSHSKGRRHPGSVLERTRGYLMATDMMIWRRRVIDELDRIADEDFQRTVWFGGGGGRWVDSPDETICAYDDLFVPRILAGPGHGLDPGEAIELERLNSLMDDLVKNTPESVRPEDLIDDPRWGQIRKQASVTLAAMKEDQAN